MNMIGESANFIQIRLRGETCQAEGTPTHLVRRGPVALSPSRAGEIGQAGGWSWWIWDGRDLVARTSAHGLIPLYYVELSDGIVLADSFTFLQSRYSKRLVDRAALLSGLILGQYLEDETVFSDIRALPLDAELRWSAGQTRIERYDRPPNPLDVDLETATKMYTDAVGGAIDRCLPHGKAVMGLSGGRDSRHILMALLERGQPPARVVTSHHPTSSSRAEVAIAHQLARRFRIPITTVHPRSDRFLAELEKNRRTDCQTLSHGWTLPLAEAMNGAPVRYDGINGGVLFGRSSVVKALRRTFGNDLPPWSELRERGVDLMCNRRLETLARLLTGPLLDPDNVEAARERIRNALERYREYPNPIQAFIYYNHVGRDTAQFTYRLMGNDEVLTPMDAPQVVQFAFALPWRLACDFDFQKIALQKRFPQAADIPLLEDHPKRRRSWLDRLRRGTINRRSEQVTFTRLRNELSKHGDPLLHDAGLERFMANQYTTKDVAALVFLAQVRAMEVGAPGDFGLL